MTKYRHRFRSRRQARQMVVSTILTLVMLNLGFILFIGRHPDWRDPRFTKPAREFAHQLEMQRDKAPVSIVFLGSSRTGNGVDPRVVEEPVAAFCGRPCIAYNLHVPGSGPIADLLYVRRLVRAGVRVKMVVVEFSPEWYVDVNGRPYKAPDLTVDRLSHDELELVNRFGCQQATIDWWKANTNPWTGFRFQVVGRAKPSWLPPNVLRPLRHPPEYHGWNPSFFQRVSHEHRQYLTGLVKQNYADNLPNIRFDNPPQEALWELLNLCRTEGIFVGLFVAPVSSTFRSWYPPQTEQRLAIFFDELRQKYDCVIADGRDWLPDEAFMDGHHVLRGSAKPYTEAILQQVILPTLKKQTHD